MVCSHIMCFRECLVCSFKYILVRVSDRFVVRSHLMLLRNIALYVKIRLPRVHYIHDILCTQYITITSLHEDTCVALLLWSLTRLNKN